MAPTFIIFCIGDEIMLLYKYRSQTLLDQFERSLSSRTLYRLFNEINNDDSAYCIRTKTPGGYLITDYTKDKGIRQYIKITNAWTYIRSFGTIEDLFVGHFNMYNHEFFRSSSVSSLMACDKMKSQQLNTEIFRKKIVAPIGSLRVKKFKGTHEPEED